MSTEYQITKRGQLNNFKDYYINVESTDREFIESIDRELDTILHNIIYGKKMWSL